jgi:hypothetical protein
MPPPPYHFEEQSSSKVPVTINPADLRPHFSTQFPAMVASLKGMVPQASHIMATSPTLDK